MTLLAGLATVLIPSDLLMAAYALAIFALCAQIASWWLQFRARGVHEVAETARRRAMLLDGLGETLEPLDIAEVRRSISQALFERAAHLNQPAQYSSSAPPGSQRLREHLCEHAFWSKCLQEAAARQSIDTFVGVAFASILVALLVLPMAGRDLSVTVARCLVLLLAFLVGFNQLGKALAWRTAAKHVDSIFRRLQNRNARKLEPLMAAFGDYGAIIATAPPIPPAVLSREWAKVERHWSDIEGDCCPE